MMMMMMIFYSCLVTLLNICNVQYYEEDMVSPLFQKSTMTKRIRKEQLVINIQQQQNRICTELKTNITIVKHKVFSSTSGKKRYFNSDRRQYGLRLISILVIPLFPYYKRSFMLSNFFIVISSKKPCVYRRVDLIFSKTTLLHETK